ncbi:MAG: hypothetical protein KF729_15810 [Sandaracinaceae bacterium]|nr:hypothetical protein [Sandaracinaceae bacterium]
MHCARHPDVAADGTCERCGDFVCRGCRHHLHPALCARCGDRLPRGIAWEDPRYGVWPWRFVLTLRDVVLRPKVAFPGPARVGPASLFALACAALAVPAFASLVLYATRATDRAAVGGALVGSALVVALATAGLVVSQALTFGVGLLMVGRKHGVMRFGLRAAAYASALWWLVFFAGVAASFAGDVPDLAWGALLALWAALNGRVFVHAARGLGLPTGSAVTAALGPTLLASVPVALLVHERLAWLAP